MKLLNKILGTEWRERLYVWTHLKRGDVFFDVGAGDGVYSKLAKRRVARVVAFEPQDKIPIKGVIWNQIALDKESGWATLYINKIDQMTGLGNTKRGKIIGEKKVKTITLDEYARSSGHIPNFIKIDTEGFEGRILEGATETLKLHPLILCELSPKNYKGLGYSIEEVKDFMQKKGYRIVQPWGFASYNFVFKPK